MRLSFFETHKYQVWCWIYLWLSGNTDYSFDLWHWHFLSEGAFSLELHNIEWGCQLCCFGFPQDPEWILNNREWNWILSYTKLVHLIINWSKPNLSLEMLLKFNSEHAINSVTHFSDFSRMLTVKLNISVDENDSLTAFSFDWHRREAQCYQAGLETGRSRKKKPCRLSFNLSLQAHYLKPSLKSILKGTVFYGIRHGHLLFLRHPQLGDNNTALS